MLVTDKLNEFIYQNRLFSDKVMPSNVKYSLGWNRGGNRLESMFLLTKSSLSEDFA